MFRKIDLNSKFFSAGEYLLYLLRGRHGSKMHSPFLFSFYKQVLSDKRHYYAFDEIENIRRELLANKKIIQVTDYGAGSKNSTTLDRRISEIAETASKSRALTQLLFRLAVFSSGNKILEMGTSLGITALYFSAQAEQLITLEGCPATAEVARSNFEKLNRKNISLLQGEFSQTLPQALQLMPSPDLIFMDGNHRYEPTVNYFNLVLPAISENAVIVLDDIYWSPEMKMAWNEIRIHPSVSVNIDLFHFGILFFRKNIAKQSVTLLL
jgi:predicted O-methyltransferase YrrM